MNVFQLAVMKINVNQLTSNLVVEIVLAKNRDINSGNEIFIQYKVFLLI